MPTSPVYSSIDLPEEDELRAPKKKRPHAVASGDAILLARGAAKHIKRAAPHQIVFRAGERGLMHRSYFRGELF
jgi:hypothetical protein